jgi:hypothetical protein
MGAMMTRMVAGALVAVLTSSVATAGELRPAPKLTREVIQQAVASAQQGTQTVVREFAAPRQGASSAHAGRRVLWTSIGAAGGFFAGGYLGSWIENQVAPCGCDDPGLKGALIGIPIGAIAGGITGFVLSK